MIGSFDLLLSVCRPAMMEWCVVEADVGFLSDGLLTPRSPGTRSMVAGKDGLDQRIENRVSGEHGGPRWVGQLNYDCERSEWYHVDAHDKGNMRREA
jgi:hypothetical protein